MIIVSGLRLDAAKVLTSMFDATLGRRYLVDVDFDAHDEMTTATVKWFAAVTMPSSAAIDAAAATAGATLATARAQAQKAAATAGIDTGALQAGDKLERLLVAELGMTLDEFNLHKDKINAILNAIDASTTYATLKTNVAAIPDYPTRTQAQLVTALKAKIAATAE